MRKISLAIAAASMSVPMVALPTAPAVAHDGYHGKTWKDSRGRWRCKRPNGTTGMLVGGAAGALAGRAIDTRGDRATGTILGAAAGALIGREIERGRSRCR
ncbi:glycine zipper 2TM domain-containing protein [Allosphingosinicella flava]|uniref:17 kDa surface antigen n=1 Tax=Allosphingosinicella flava TaxID=2771430 RepID=A0A7T2GJ81_9SPHN|nr:glycine zipper 2TM domain-containing protein [Sphingosinicella flava]QPQ54883.1 glycine zipper 2TM domain-containing protein [Sphingosinicella flava]